ncbi:MAG: hypothetical protein RLN62_04170 [Rickettsiales bacterium]
MSYNITDFLRPEFTPHRFTSGNQEVDMILRWDNWNNATGQPVTLTYRFDHISEKFSNSHLSNFAYALSLLSDYVFGEVSGENQNIIQYSLSENYIPQNKQGYYQNSEDWELGLFKKKWDELQPKNSKFCKEAIDSIPQIRNYALPRYQEMLDSEDDVSPKFFTDNSLNLFGNCTFGELQNNKHALENILFNDKEGVKESFLFESFVEESVGLWSRYANINFARSQENPQITIDLGGGPVDAPVWNNGQTISTDLSIQTYEEQTFEQMIGSAHFISEVHHGVGHAFLDHPEDSVMFDDRTTEFRKWTGHSNHSLSHHGTVLSQARGSGMFDPISPMPTDILALQHLYTPRCNEEVTIFSMNGQGKVTPLYNYNIPNLAIFTIWDCKPAILDLSGAEGQNIKLDLNEGIGHVSEVGRDHFLLAHGTKIGKIILPENMGEYSVEFNPEFDTEIVAECAAVNTMEFNSKNISSLPVVASLESGSQTLSGDVFVNQTNVGFA